MTLKIYIILHFLFLSAALFSQKRESIYLEIPKPSSVSKDENLSVEIYRLIFNSCADKLIKLYVDKNNIITKQIIVKSESKPTVIFTYHSHNNPPRSITGNSINFLSQEDLQNIEPTCLIEALNHFENIFIVDEKKRARKVSFKVLGNL